MGMFDELRCRYPLPMAGANEHVYQTKDLDCQMDSYEIREDGTLWHQDYDVEDHSDPNAEGIMRLAGAMARVRQRWEKVEDFTGEIQFYDFIDAKNMRGWVEWSAYFKAGQLQQVNLLQHEPVPTPPQEGE